MRKYRLRNKIKSIVGSYIDPDKDEELKGSNLEAEDNYKKILELLKDEDQDDKTKLIGLIEEFHKCYQSIYERYDNVTSKLRDKIHSKKENSSSSSSSDSDSDNSSTKNGNENRKLKNKIYSELQTANTEIKNLKSKLAVETQEKETLSYEYQETEKMFNELTLEADKLHEENSKLLHEKNENNLKFENALETIKELQTTIIQLEGEKDGFASKLNEMEVKTRSLEENLEVLHSMKTKIEKQKQDKIENLQQDLEMINNMKVELETEIYEKIREISEYLIEIEFLKQEVENKNAKVESFANEIKRFEIKIKEMEDEKEKGISSKDHIIDKLEETIEDLKSDIEMKGDEVNSLMETVSNLEVKIRLANQKLRVTEQTLNEQEIDHARKEEKFHQENKSLIDKISSLSETITSIITSIKRDVQETLIGFDSLTVKFEEDYGHLQTRVFEMTNEVEAGKVQIKKTITEKDELKQKVSEMAVNLKAVEGDNEGLKKTMVEMEKKILELKNAISVKDEGILYLGEEKREAIRQLCLWVDYQRDRCVHLQELLFKTTTAGRRHTVAPAR